VTERLVTLVVWAVLAAALVGCGVVVRAAPGRWPTPGDLVRRLTARWAGLALVVLVWMWLGWHAFAR
jgi:hypothetical protein